MLSGVHDLVGKARLTTMRKKAQDFDQRSRSSARGIQTRGKSTQGLGEEVGLKGSAGSEEQEPHTFVHQKTSPHPLLLFLSQVL